MNVLVLLVCAVVGHVAGDICGIWLSPMTCAAIVRQGARQKNRRIWSEDVPRLLSEREEQLKTNLHTNIYKKHRPHKLKSLDILIHVGINTKHKCDLYAIKNGICDYKPTSFMDSDRTGEFMELPLLRRPLPPKSRRLPISRPTTQRRRKPMKNRILPIYRDRTRMRKHIYI